MRTDMATAANLGWSNSVAIIGMSGRFPGARDLVQFWDNLKNGVESISFFSEPELEQAGVDERQLQRPGFVNAGGVLEDIELFDAPFFRINAREAESLDPQQRLLLECAWHAMEDAGYDPERCAVPVGVFAGAAMSTYLFNLLSHPEFRDLVGDFQVFTGNDKDFLTTRISYKLNLKGPSLAVQSACSTALVAVSMACDSLLNHQCDMALAGGVAIRVPQKAGYIHREGEIFSRDGHTRSFDAAANGTVFTNGAGLVVLKRMADAIDDGDCIRAAIRGSAVNNDGSVKVGYAAPSLEAQAEVVAMALALAEVPPSTISYVEAHGTATPLGDPIEIAALCKAFRTEPKHDNFCALGSVKSNVGHLDTASGIAALIKTVLALEHKVIPPSINFSSPNPKIGFNNSPFYVNTRLSPWNGPAPRRAGVHSFGIGGTNAHVVLEEAPERESPVSRRARQLLVWSARTKAALQAMTTNLGGHLRKASNASVADVAYTGQIGRKEFTQRRILVCADAGDAVAALESVDPQRVITGMSAATERSAVFLFPGQGAQYPNMGLELYRTEPTFCDIVDHCSALLRARLGFELREILYPEPNQLRRATAEMQRTEIGELSLFVMEYALAQLWMEWGIRPECMLGQSIGEYVAACVAGVFSLPDAIDLLTQRSALLKKTAEGAMIVLPVTEREATKLLGSELDLAAVNSPSECVLSGPVAAIERLASSPEGRFVPLSISQALHSRSMEPIVRDLAAAFAGIEMHPPKIPYISNLTGTWTSATAATDPASWAAQLSHTVRFSDGIASLWKAPERIFLEVGPGQALTKLALRHPARVEESIILSSMPALGSGLSEAEAVFSALGRLWLQGVKVNWQGFWKHERRLRVPLPTYAFDRKRYWVERQRRSDASETEKAFSERVPAIDSGESTSRGQNCGVRVAETAPDYAEPADEVQKKIAEIWQKLLGVERVGIYDSFFSLGGHSMQGAQLVSMLHSTFHVAIPLPTLFEVPTVAGMAERVRALQ